MIKRQRGWNPLADQAQDDRDTLLPIIAVAQHRQAPTTTEALARRARWPNARTYNAIAGLKDRGMVFNATSIDTATWVLTEAGWAAVGQIPPLWMREVAA